MLASRVRLHAHRERKTSIDLDHYPVVGRLQSPKDSSSSVRTLRRVVRHRVPVDVPVNLQDVNTFTAIQNLT